MNLASPEMSAEAVLRTGRLTLGDLNVVTLDAVGLSKHGISMFPGDLSLIFVKSGFITLKSVSGLQRLNSECLYIANPLAIYKQQNFDSQTKLISISIPKHLFLEGGFITKSFEGIAANMSNPDARAVADLILSIVEQNGSTSLALRERQGRHLLDLVGILVGNPLAVVSPGKRDMTLLRAKNYVAQHLDDLDLNVSRIATSIGVSPSQLNRLFKDRSKTVMRYVWSCRLDRAADLLRRRDRSNISIGEIAYSCGFTNHAHFSRVFKERFGMSPSGYVSLRAVESNATFTSKEDAENGR
ncbi:helix-turn-helix transcriptional regulator [Paraburkholderia solisilvae]|uniref:HTH-type transcriptional activator RhaR n=1 Tax=Paraburkholderia solisilvae TaxID=624376 RepID=A0A6J5DSK5_9BURK|nr:helix-turn-helix transcriptional regulator [Paraburkholderia solisilvae]CAB3756484.1 HTH-type transcriptional activator RhaR [Paraburkholderia solisilvae]